MSLEKPLSEQLRHAEALREMRPRMTPQSRRHAAPPGPWPWMDLSTKGIHDSPPPPDPACPPDCIHVNCIRRWSKYPQSLFPNWTPPQVERSAIARAVRYRPIVDGKEVPCIIHVVDVLDSGFFVLRDQDEVSEDNKDEFYLKIQNKREDGIRLRCLFLERLSGPVLQMLGTKYNVEPFFWSSALNWIPSRFQEELRQGVGDHITITLTFLRTRQGTDPKSDSESQLPLADVTLVLDLLAIHMVRRRDGSTILSFHPPEYRATSARHLHSRIWEAGQSVYWQNVYYRTTDPTFILLAFLWYALYAWDEALEMLYHHIDTLEPDILEMSDIGLTQRLHHIRAHLLNYATLLADFHNAVTFVLNTSNPALKPEVLEKERPIMVKECKNLLAEIERLQQGRDIHSRRLRNVMNLVFSSVNIEDSKHMKELTQIAVADSAVMKELTQAAVRDSAAMKQIAYLTMVFLPASFAAGVFGMNIKEINPGTGGTLAHYVETAVPLTILTVWVVMAIQSQNYFETSHASFRARLAWPMIIFRTWWTNLQNRRQNGRPIDANELPS